MRKVTVLQVFGSLEMGGAESRMMDVYRNMDRDAYTVDFLTMKDGIQHYEPELIASGTRVIHIKNPRHVSVFRHIAQLHRVMKEGHYQAVHAHTSYHCGIALLAAWMAHVPVRIAHARTTGTKQTSLKTRIASCMGKGLIRAFSTQRLAISKNAGAYLFGNMSFRVVPNSICTAQYINSADAQIFAFKQELDIPQDAFVIGQIGRFDGMKNHKFTLQWFANYKKSHADAWLVFVGDGALRQEMEELAEALGIRRYVRFTGVRADVPQLIRIFNVLFFPSLFEGLGGVVLEAQAAGVPVVESENIPAEADLGIGMVTQCRLEAELSIWSAAVNACRSFAAPSKEEIAAAFDKNGYSIDAVTNIYCRLYAGEE